MMARGYTNVKHTFRGVFGWWKGNLPLADGCVMKLPDPINAEEELLVKEF